MWLWRRWSIHQVLLFNIFFYFLRTLFLFEYFQSLSLLNSRRTGKKTTIYFPKYFLDYFWKCYLKKSLLFNVKPNNSVLLHIFFLNLDWRGLKAATYKWFLKCWLDLSSPPLYPYPYHYKTVISVSIYLDLT